MAEADRMDRNLAMEIARVAEAAALSASLEIGRGDENRAAWAAIEAARQALNSLDVDGEIVVGEGEPDETPMLYIGEAVGTGAGPAVDIAINPLDGAGPVAAGGPNALTVVAMAARGGFLNVPDSGMEVIAAGSALPADALDLDAPPVRNLQVLARAKQAEIADLTVCMLDWPGQDGLIEEIRRVGARVIELEDGAIGAIAATALPDSGVDLYMGLVDAPAAVIGAAALRCLGGRMLGRLACQDDDERARARRYGFDDATRIFDLHALATGEIMFAATGVTTGPLLRGVRRFHNGAITHSLVMRSKSGTVRSIQAHHDFTRKSGFLPMDR